MKLTERPHSDYFDAWRGNSPLHAATVAECGVESAEGEKKRTTNHVVSKAGARRMGMSGGRPKK